MIKRWWALFLWQVLTGAAIVAILELLLWLRLPVWIVAGSLDLMLIPWMLYFAANALDISARWSKKS